MGTDFEALKKAILRTAEDIWGGVKKFNEPGNAQGINYPLGAAGMGVNLGSNLALNAEGKGFGVNFNNSPSENKPYDTYKSVFGAGKAEASVPAATPPVVAPVVDPNMVVPPVSEQRRLTHFGAGSGIPTSDIALPQDYTEKVKALGYGSEASGVAMKGKANLGQTFTNKDLAFITGEDPTKTGPTPEEMTAIIAKRDADNAEIERGFGVSGKGVTFEDLINKSFQAGNEARAMKRSANELKKAETLADIEYKKGMLGVAQKPKPLDIGDMVKGFTAILTDPDATVEEKATARESLRTMLGVEKTDVGAIKKKLKAAGKTDEQIKAYLDAKGYKE